MLCHGWSRPLDRAYKSARHCWWSDTDRSQVFSIGTVEAPASTAFSSNSFTALAGRWITSPAAIWLAMLSGSNWIMSGKWRFLLVANLRKEGGRSKLTGLLFKLYCRHPVKNTVKTPFFIIVCRRKLANEKSGWLFPPYVNNPFRWLNLIWPKNYLKPQTWNSSYQSRRNGSSLL